MRRSPTMDTDCGSPASILLNIVASSRLLPKNPRSSLMSVRFKYGLTAAIMKAHYYSVHPYTARSNVPVRSTYAISQLGIDTRSTDLFRANLGGKADRKH